MFDSAIELGFDMQLLDIGGGFTGHFDSHGNVMFGEIASTINEALAKHFPPEQVGSNVCVFVITQVMAYVHYVLFVSVGVHSTDIFDRCWQWLGCR